MKVHIWGCHPEANHAIDLFRDNQVEVVPQGTYSPGMFNDQNVWCWGDDSLFSYLHNEDPRQVVYWPCSNTLNDRELVGIAKTKNLKIFCQSMYQLGQLKDRLNAVDLSTDIQHVHPFFNVDSYRFVDKPLDRLNVIHVGNDEPLKYPNDMWDLFYKVATPSGVSSKLLVVGWGDEGERFLGNIGNVSHPYHGKITAEVQQACTPNEMFNHLRDAHAHLMFYPFHENAPHEMFEAIALGSVVVGANHGGIPEFIRDQETGFLVSSNDEASHRLSQLAFNPSKARRMAQQAYDNLKKGIGCPKCAFSRFSKELK
jgi:glycosyltransferase involved in cell wall biosynthesis